jgi:DNA-directed RNA polymerase specialized sigma24 family protein
LTGGGAVTEQTLPQGAEARDISAQLQERIRAFTAFYEQHAYLAYNLALRITCQPEPAVQAVQGAFLSQLEDRPAGLLPATVAAALHEASRHPEPGGAGEPEAQRLMAAMAELAPPERAALSLADLAHAGPDGIGAALNLDVDQAGKLLHRGREAFGARLGLPRPQADEAARNWMWAAPPAAIWEELYPRFHRATERDLRRGAGEQTLVLGPTEASRAPAGAHAKRRRRVRARGLRPRSNRLRWSPRPRWALILPTIIVLTGGGIAADRMLRGGSKGGQIGSGGSGAGPSVGPAAPGTETPVPPTGASGQPAVPPHKPLTAAELDKLRLRELDQLNAYTRRQANKDLPPAQRNAAAQGIANLQREADRRLRAELKREQALRDQLARERARAKAPPPPPPPPGSQRTPAPQRQAPRRHNTTPSGPHKRGQVEQTCLLDQDTGQYICPQ